MSISIDSMPVHPCMHIFRQVVYIPKQRKKTRKYKIPFAVWQVTNANSSCTFIAYLSERSCETIALIGSIYVRGCVCVCVCMNCLHCYAAATGGNLKACWILHMQSPIDRQRERELCLRDTYLAQILRQSVERGVCRCSMHGCVCMCVCVCA